MTTQDSEKLSLQLILILGAIAALTPVGNRHVPPPQCQVLQEIWLSLRVQYRQL